MINITSFFNILICVLSFFPHLPIFQSLENFSTHITEYNYTYFQVLDYLNFRLLTDNLPIAEARLLLGYYLATFINIFDINRLMLPSLSFILEITDNLADISSLRDYFNRHAIFVITREYISGIWPNLWEGRIYNHEDDFILSTGSAGRDFHSTFRMLNHLAETFQNSSRSLDSCNAFPPDATIDQVYNTVAPVSADVPRSYVSQFFAGLNVGSQEYVVWVALFTNLAIFFHLSRDIIEALNDPVTVELFNLLVRELIRLFGHGPLGK